MKKKVYIGILPVLVLLIFGVLNFYKKLTWKEPTDGVSWEMRSGVLTAVNVEVNSPAYLGGIKKEDILYSINNNLTKNKIDVLKNLWVAGSSNQKVTYQINREGELIFPSFYLTRKGVNLIYYYLALIGLTTLVVGFIVFLQSKTPFSKPYVYFYFLSLAFYSFYIFSPTGELNILDSAFYWLDKVAFLLSFFLC